MTSKLFYLERKELPNFFTLRENIAKFFYFERKELPNFFTWRKNNCEICLPWEKIIAKLLPWEKIIAKFFTWEKLMAEVFWVVFPLYFLIFAYFNKSKHGIQFWDVGTLTSSDYLCGAWISPKPLICNKKTNPVVANLYSYSYIMFC